MSWEDIIVGHQNLQKKTESHLKQLITLLKYSHYSATSRGQ